MNNIPPLEVTMKYMTFNSSCSYAGVANMLLQLGYNVEDWQIALGMHLPYLFDLQDGIYATGPMLQNADWFNLYLHPLGYAMTETVVSKSEIPNHLHQCGIAMLGLRITPSNKHAVVFTGMDEENFRFINNKWCNDDAPESLLLSTEALKDRLDDTVMVATLKKVPASTPDFHTLFHHSCQVLEQYKTDIQIFCQNAKNKEERFAAMNSLFRATLLDGITMLELIGQKELAERFRHIQRPFLAAIQEETPVVLTEKLDIQSWLSAIDAYIALIKDRCQ